MDRINLSECAIVDVPIDEIVRYQNNPRSHPERQLAMIEASFRRFDVVHPILLTERRELIAGEGRLIVAERLGLETMPALILPHLTEAEVTAFRIADNKIALESEWSVELLATELELVCAVDLDFEPMEIGFSTGEVDSAIKSGRSSKKFSQDPIVEPDRNVPAVSRPGDVFTIGRHAVACGDARDPASFRLLLGERRADAVISDQPWNLPAKFIGGNGRSRHADFVMAAGEMPAEEFRLFTEQVLENQARYARSGALVFQFIDWRSIDMMIAAGKKTIGRLVNICIWSKPSAGMGQPWRSQHEMVPVFCVRGAKPTDNVQLGMHGRNRSNVWTFPSPTGFGSEREKLKLHPTCKNEEMIGEAIMDCTNRHDVVLDAFLGSGSTILAAHRTGRIGVGIELDPHYVDLAVGRIAETAQSEPMHQDGLSFEELRMARLNGERGQIDGQA